jgi:hypothetical protein
MELLALITLVLSVMWAIFLYQQIYTPFLISTILLAFFGLMWIFTTPAQNAVMFGYAASFVMSALGYIGLALGGIGILYIIKGQRGW